MISNRFRQDSTATASMTLARQEAIERFKQKLASGIYREKHNPCPCGQNDDELLAEKERWGVPMKTVICRQCGIVRTDPRLDESSQKDFYSDEYPLITAKVDYVKKDEYFYISLFRREYHRCYHIDAILKEALERTGDTELKSFFSKSNSPKIADIGCGTGGMMQYFINRGYQAVGCDYGKKAVAYGLSKGLDIVEGDASSIGVRKGPVDLVIMSHILEHVAWPHTFIDKAVKLLRPGGLLYIELPGILDISAHRNRNDLLRYLRVYHMLNFSLRSLSNLVESHGFKLLYGDQWIKALYKYEGIPSLPMLREPGEYQKIRRRLQLIERLRPFTAPYSVLADWVRHNQKYFADVITAVGLKKPIKAVMRHIGYRDLET